MLKEIFDNLTLHCGKFDTYFDVYERHFDKFVNKNPIVVEVGICRGGSAEMWKKYFGEGATIIGIDIDPNAFKIEHQTPGCIQVYGNQADPEFWKKFFEDYPEVDIFIDDGGHHQSQQITTLYAAWPHIKNNGVFLCEDTHTSYWDSYGGGFCRESSFIEYCKRLTDTVNLDHFKDTQDQVNLFEHYTNLNSIHYYDSIVVLEKSTKVKSTLLTSTPI